MDKSKPGAISVTKIDHRDIPSAIVEPFTEKLVI